MGRAGQGDSGCQDVGKFAGRMPGQDHRVGPMCLSRKEAIALELQASPGMDPPTLPECRLLSPQDEDTELENCNLVGTHPSRCRSWAWDSHA